MKNAQGLQTGDHNEPRTDWHQCKGSMNFLQGKIQLLEQLHMVIRADEKICM